MHGIDTGNSDTVPYHVNSEHTLNWFRVYWNDGDYPGSSSSNTCAARNCGETEDGNCFCTTTVAESVVFDNINPLSKIDVLSQLFIGATGPQNFSVPSPGDGFIAHIVANAVDASTVFEVQGLEIEEVRGERACRTCQSSVHVDQQESWIINKLSQRTVHLVLG